MRFLLGLAVLLASIGAAGCGDRCENEAETIRRHQAAARSVLVEPPREPRIFALRDPSGKLVRLSDFKGKPILINFWASWCPPCLDELPSLLRLAQWASARLGMVTLAVSVDQEWKAVRKLFEEKKLWPRGEPPFTMLLDPAGTEPRAYGTSKFPESFFVDRDFRLVRKFVGPQEWTSREIVEWLTENSKAGSR